MLTCVSAICNPILNILLQGNEDLSEEQNFHIINAVHNFITKSNRCNLAWSNCILISFFSCRLSFSPYQIHSHKCMHSPTVLPLTLTSPFPVDVGIMYCFIVVFVVVLLFFILSIMGPVNIACSILTLILSMPGSGVIFICIQWLFKLVPKFNGIEFGCLCSYISQVTI